MSKVCVLQINDNWYTNESVWSLSFFCPDLQEDLTKKKEAKVIYLFTTYFHTLATKQLFRRGRAGSDARHGSSFPVNPNRSAKHRAKSTPK